VGPGGRDSPPPGCQSRRPPCANGTRGASYACRQYGSKDRPGGRWFLCKGSMGPLQHAFYLRSRCWGWVKYLAFRRTQRGETTRTFRWSKPSLSPPLNPYMEREVGETMNKPPVAAGWVDMGKRRGVGRKRKAKGGRARGKPGRTFGGAGSGSTDGPCGPGRRWLSHGGCGSPAATEQSPATRTLTTPPPGGDRAGRPRRLLAGSAPPPLSKLQLRGNKQKDRRLRRRTKRPPKNIQTGLYNFAQRGGLGWPGGSPVS